eukprot:CAMPEP_0194396986 /NCGR_PEP_ID=MMETSP0174-20130528/125292_1 /TAXON_ID=216777 /ORGANISM="Proboscia alata, Strain PI-D3" /LENGTH=1062 /DNA_ID=CAMNT_0039193111 /DNA_START=51 /DNA_END=3239 /DNA_ORIENTATION=-
MDFDQNRIYYAHLNLQQDNNPDGNDGPAITSLNRMNDPDGIDDNDHLGMDLLEGDLNLQAVRRHFREFLRNYRQGEHRYLYRDRLLRLHRRSTVAQHLQNLIQSESQDAQNNSSSAGSSVGSGSINVNLAHVGEYDAALLDLLLSRPATVLPAFEIAAADALRTLLYDMQQAQSNTEANPLPEEEDDQSTSSGAEQRREAATRQRAMATALANTLPTSTSIQILLTGNLTPTPLRSLTASHMNRLLLLPGILISTSRIRSRASYVSLRCSRCSHTHSIHIANPYTSTPLPKKCLGPNPAECGLMPYVMLPDESRYVDQQSWKLQECPEAVPTGEMPRSVVLCAERNLVDVAPPGTRITVVGIASLFHNLPGAGSKGSGVKTIYLRVVGPNPAECGLMPYVMLPDESRYVDQQSWKLQECPEAVPTGEMPRSVVLCAERNLVDVAPPGTRITVVGIASLFHNLPGAGSKGSGVKTIYLRVVGLARNSNATNAIQFTPREEESFHRLSKHPNLYHILSSSVAPSISGSYTVDIKKSLMCQLFGGSLKRLPDRMRLRGDIHVLLMGALMCQLFGGSLKRLPDRMRLRGDIHVLLMGDPSTAKSQFLKFIERVAPIGVYTSGKGSSAAGLTASVIRDKSGEFYLEGGAMVLADGGCVCIDEFDKMRAEDRVAIHEAMEQQTISVTKAGLHATLNARASLLAAANPVGGRYDRSRTLRGNVALSAPILSRFDLFFVVLDECEEVSDYNVAKHILEVHRGLRGSDDAYGDVAFPKASLQKYIRYARTLNPKITLEAQKVLVECYGVLRQGDSLGRSRSAYRITVRQLESMIRLSEALARLHLDDDIKPEYVREACRLLRKSIIHVETEDVTFDDEEEEELGGGGEGGGGDDAPNTARMSVATTITEEGDEPPTAQDTEPSTVVPPNPDPNSTNPNPTPNPPPSTKPKKKKKKKTQITFEQYEAIANGISTHLRSLETSSSSSNLTWTQATEWYLTQVTSEIGESEEEADKMRKLVNMVIKRLVEKDRVLMFMDDGGVDGETGEADGGGGGGKTEEKERLLGVHPNYVI